MREMVSAAGFEPATHALKGRCSLVGYKEPTSYEGVPYAMASLGFFGALTLGLFQYRLLHFPQLGGFLILETKSRSQRKQWCS
jgi:hypothetical protein